MKSLDFDEKSGKFIRREEIQIGNTTEANEIRQSLKIELVNIVKQVKGLKNRAEEIKKMLDALDRKTEPTGSASVEPPA